MATLSKAVVTNDGRFAGFVGALLLAAQLVYAMKLHLLPPTG